MSVFSLPEQRLERALADKKPLYTHAEAVAEANRCLYCADAPCIKACPTGIDIPTFIHKIQTDNVKGAARTIFESNLLGYSCARVCPVEVLCAGDCVYNHWGRPPIQIGRLQRYATEVALADDPTLVSKKGAAPTGRKVACVGAGPASLACAGHLALLGHSVTLFEKKDLPGGLNTLGIAPYKLQAEDALAEIRFILELGDITLMTGVGVVEGESNDGEVSAADLLADFDAVFVGIGLGPDTFLDIPGEDGTRVVGATRYIERLKSDPDLSLKGIKTVAVVGGGNTAIDVAREMALLGVPEVVMVYRGTGSQMPGYAHEMHGARTEGVRLLENRQPVRIVRDEQGELLGLEVQRMKDKRPVTGAFEVIPVDLVAMAIGQSRLTGLAAAFGGVAVDAKGRVVVDPATCGTGNPKVYAGGDCVNGGKEVVNAAQHGKLAAMAMHAAFAAK
ncbi:MAG: FAD-dependent oxidoreductase [Deltaproteobacteria bacterium]|nr:FAD-dependent oxidoreductase [Deltaproteobacteria bacterium]